MDDFMNEKAVACRSGKQAAEILVALLNSGAMMVQSYHFDSTVQKQPQGTGAVDPNPMKR